MDLFKATSKQGFLKAWENSKALQKESLGFKPVFRDESDTDYIINTSIFTEQTEEANEKLSYARSGDTAIDEIRGTLAMINSEIASVVSKSQGVFQKVSAEVEAKEVGELIKELNFKLVESISHSSLLSLELKFHEHI